MLTIDHPARSLPVSSHVTSAPSDEAIGVYRALVEHAREPILAVDRRGELLFANQAAARIFGNPEQTTDRRVFAFVHPEDVGRLRTSFDRAMGDLQASTVLEVRIRDHDGDWRLVECMVRGIIDNVTLYGLVHMRDVSARRSLEARLRHAQKLTKLGRLTVALAYDLDDQVNTMQCHIRALVESASSEDTVPFSLLAVKRAAESAGALSRQLMAFGQTTAVVSSPACLHEMLTNLGDKIRRILGRTVWLQVSLAATRSVARVEKENLDLAVMNLLMQMHEAMPLSGTIAIGTRDVRVPGGSPSAPSSDFIVIDISNAVLDESPDVESRLFEPPSDLPEASMLALGLVLLHDIVTAAGGFVEFATKGGVGIVIRAFLPSA